MAANAATSRVTLDPVRLGPIRNGGYIIGYDGAVPNRSTLLLGLPDVDHSMDVTGRKQKDLLGPDNLPTFLSLIGKQKWWGMKGRCTLFVMNGDTVVTRSTEQLFDCPVRPYVGPLRPEMGKGDAGPALKYTGVSDGRMLFMPALDGCYYFAFNGRFETENDMRGFNCITYAGAVLGVDPSTKAMAAYGTQLANHCGCVPCNLENKSLADVRAFFAKNRVGTYLMWSEHHTVLVVNGMVHEFRQLLGRYNTQPVGEWTHSDSRWWVRKTPKQF